MRRARRDHARARRALLIVHELPQPSVGPDLSSRRSASAPGESAGAPSARHPTATPTTARRSRRSLARHDCGITFFDTSAAYGNGHSEALIGEALSGVRHEVVLATKAGYEAWDRPPDFSAAAIVASTERSLGRLRTDYLDLLLLHNPPLDVLLAARRARGAGAPRGERQDPRVGRLVPRDRLTPWKRCGPATCRSSRPTST